jgi:hypothetical protein
VAPGDEPLARCAKIRGNAGDNSTEVYESKYI